MITISGVGSLERLVRASLEASFAELAYEPAMGIGMKFGDAANPDDIQAVRAALKSATGAAVPQ